jgi:phosphatidylglycerol lysyltransferase
MTDLDIQETATVGPTPRTSMVSTHVVGAFLRRQWASLQWDWPIWLVASATFVNGLLGIVSILTVRFAAHPKLFSVSLPFGLYHWSRSLTLVFGFVLMYLSFHLLHRRRVAWWLALVGAALAALAHIGRGRVWYAALGPLLLLGLLLFFRRRFAVRSEPRSIAQGLGLMAASLAVALAYGTAGFWLLDLQDFGINFHLGDALVRTLRELTFVGNNDLIAGTRHARWFLDSLRMLGLVTGLFGLYSLFRPVAFRLRALPQQRVVVGQILDRNGGTSVDYFKLWPDKSYFFSADQSCCIAYRTALGVAISLGDPVGPADELENLTCAFKCLCSDNGWGVAFHQVPPKLLPLYERLGFQSLKIGEEATVDLEQFASHTSNLKHFHHTRRKFEKDGYQALRYLPPHEPSLMDQVAAVSQEWLTLPGHRERSFTLGSFDLGYLNATPLFVLQEASGRILAFVNEIPSYRSGERTIDLMRHRLDVPNSTMDYLFLELMLRLHQEGYRWFSLGMAPMAGVGEAPDAPLEERAARELADHLGRFFSYKGLRSYKAKFEPLWEERFLIYQGGPMGLVKTILALTRAAEG